MNIAIVGSRHLALAPSEVPEGTILLRHGTRIAGRFERAVAALCASLGQTVEWRMPDKGSGATFDRDNAMIADADLVLAFVTPADLAERSGTMHVVESAIAQGKPCRLYLVETSLIGS
jgi:hypothetical protein